MTTEEYIDRWNAMSERQRDIKVAEKMLGWESIDPSSLVNHKPFNRFYFIAPKKAWKTPSGHVVKLIRLNRTHWGRGYEKWMPDFIEEANEVEKVTRWLATNHDEVIIVLKGDSVECRLFKHVPVCDFQVTQPTLGRAVGLAACLAKMKGDEG